MRAWMISTDTNNVRPCGSWIKILLDKLRLSLRFRLRLPEIDDVRNPLIAHAAIGSPGRAGLFKGARARKRILLVFGIVVLMMGANSAFAQTQTCAIVTGGAGSPGAGVNPTYLANQDGRANEGCTILITLNADGSITTTHPNPATSFDSGLDDNLIGVINKTSQTITGLQLSSATVPIFAFDNDGVCAGPPGYTFSALGPNPNCAIATDPHHYGPAGINFTVINANTGIVNFGNGGIAPNSISFFSLEGGNLTKIVVVVDPGLAITKQVSVVGSLLTANYSAVYGPLPPGQSIDVRFRAQIAAGLPAGTTLTNTALVTWNTPTRTSSASVSINIGETSTPNLVLTKTGPATMSTGQLGQFGLNVQNTGVSDAWNPTILDRLPKASPTGGMCSFTPQTLSAQVFQANGVTPVPGKGPLVPGADFSINYSGAPNCELTLTMLTAAATISQNQHLIINYRTQLDGNSQAGATLTNVAGAIQWFDASSTTPNRNTFTGPLTNGTPGVLDNQDAHTVTVVMSQLTITKQVSVVGGGAALPGGQLDYLVHVTNTSTSPATPVVITDDISSAGAGRLTFVNPAPTMNGSTAGVTVAGSVLTANYSAVNGPLQPGQSIDVRFRAQIASGLPVGTTLTNTAVVTWNNPPQTVSASVSIDIGGVPGSGSLNGTAWLDANFNKIADLGEPLLQGWTVGLYLNGALVQSVLTDASGAYRFSSVPPTDGTANRYELRFTAPGAGTNTAKLGKADSVFTNSLQRITDIAVPSGSNLQNLNLPIGPNGVVYNSLTRAPIAGATLKMLRGSTPLPATCFDDPAQQGQINQAGGYYRFDVNFSDPACPSGGSYLIVVTAPTSNYVAGESLVIPPSSNAATASFSVSICPTDALPAIPYCEAQASEFAPPPSVPARSPGTRYYLNLTLDGTAVPGSNQIYNNHIPLDPQLAGAFSITKTTPRLNVTRGQLIPYSITISNVIGASLQGVQIVDRYPAGFRYVPGSARLDGLPTEPTVAARDLTWNGVNFGSSNHRTIVLLLAAGAGVGEGEFVNRAQVIEGLTGKPLSGEATARVRVVPDQTFDCTDVFGKVFNDVNRNGVQDDGEDGLPGVRVVTARGLEATTDQYGRYHITCAITPNEDRGSNFVLKLDDRTLPGGFRMSTDQMQIKRATRGKALRINFGASIYRVVAIDLSDAAFERGTTEIRIQ